MKLPAHDVRRIAVEARRDPRTVRNVLEGRPAKDVAKQDVLEAAERLGYMAEERKTGT
jgi:DNA-binding LacI/PurR family transcriptional regulator